MMALIDAARFYLLLSIVAMAVDFFIESNSIAVWCFLIISNIYCAADKITKEQK